MRNALQHCTSKNLQTQRNQLNKFFLVLTIAYGSRFIFFSFENLIHDAICRKVIGVVVAICNRLGFNCFAIIPMIYLHHLSFKEKDFCDQDHRIGTHFGSFEGESDAYDAPSSSDRTGSFFEEKSEARTNSNTDGMMVAFQNANRLTKRESYLERPVNRLGESKKDYGMFADFVLLHKESEEARSRKGSGKE